MHQCVKGAGCLMKKKRYPKRISKVKRKVFRRPAGAFNIQNANDFLSMESTRLSNKIVESLKKDNAYMKIMGPFPPVYKPKSALRRFWEWLMFVPEPDYSGLNYEQY